MTLPQFHLGALISSDRAIPLAQITRIVIANDRTQAPGVRYIVEVHHDDQANFYVADSRSEALNIRDTILYRIQVATGQVQGYQS